MEKTLRAELERYGSVEYRFDFWATKPQEYWICKTGWKNRAAIAAEFQAKYPAYRFTLSSEVCNNTEYFVINIKRNEQRG